MLKNTTPACDGRGTFIHRYTDTDENNADKLCTQIFEKIAREGRKYGLGLMVSSQRPAELSQTVLSQCNSFILHRIVTASYLPKETISTEMNDVQDIPGTDSNSESVYIYQVDNIATEEEEITYNYAPNEE